MKKIFLLVVVCFLFLSFIVSANVNAQCNDCGGGEASLAETPPCSQPRVSTVYEAVPREEEYTVRVPEVTYTEETRTRTVTKYIPESHEETYQVSIPILKYREETRTRCVTDCVAVPRTVCVPGPVCCDPCNPCAPPVQTYCERTVCEYLPQTRQETFTVTVPYTELRTEQRTRTVTCNRPIQVEEQYSVTVPHCTYHEEKRTRTVTDYIGKTKVDYVQPCRPCPQPCDPCYDRRPVCPPPAPFDHSAPPCN